MINRQIKYCEMLSLEQDINIIQFNNTNFKRSFILKIKPFELKNNNVFLQCSQWVKFEVNDACGSSD